MPVYGKQAYISTYLFNGKMVLMARDSNIFRGSNLSDDWMAEANCIGLTKYFFPPPAETARARSYREDIAKTIC